MLDKPVDGPSRNGQFGWERIGSGVPELAIPVIVRANETRYSPVRIVELEIIKKYDKLPQYVFQCITLKSFYLTAHEARLLNEINYNHCDHKYGEAYFSSKDVIISAEDVKSLSRYLNISLELYTKGIAELEPHLGIVEIFISPAEPAKTLLLPYIAKLREGQLTRLVPYKLVEPYARPTPTSALVSPDDWDLMYLKMIAFYCHQNLPGLITKESRLILIDSLVTRTSNTPIRYTTCKQVPGT